MDKMSLYPFIHFKENLGLNLQTTKSTSDNSTKFKTMQIIQNQISMENFIQETKTQLVIIHMLNYMIGRSRTMKHKQEGARLYKKYRKIPPNNASYCPLCKKTLRRKLGNTLPYNLPMYILHKYQDTTHACRTSFQKYW